MPRFPHAFPVLLTLLPLLAGCARETDTFRPRIVITAPAAGSVSRQASTTVRGYVMDDSGVRSLTVNEQDIKLQGSGKIKSFEFRTQVDGDNSNYVLKATDQAGLSTSVELPIRFDSTPPRLEVTKFEREGNALRVTGVATDNVKVSSISVDGSRLTVGGGTRVPFYAEATGEFVDIVVVDTAGNRLTRRVEQ